MRSPSLLSEISPADQTGSNAGLPHSPVRGTSSGAHEDSPSIADTGLPFGSHDTGTGEYRGGLPSSSALETQSTKPRENTSSGSLSADMGESSGPDERTAL